MATEVTEQTLHDPKLWDGLYTEYIRGTVDTDVNGDGTLSVTLDGDYASEPVVAIDDAVSDDTAAIQNKDTTGFDIAISGSGTTSGTVDVLVLAQGPKR